MADFANVNDVEAARGRPLTAAQKIAVATQLGFASAIIRSKVPRLTARLADGTLDPDLVKGVAVAMVLRYLNNPEGLVQEGIEDYNRTRDRSTSSGQVYLADDELELLSPSSSGAFSVAPSQEHATLHDRRRIARHRQSWGRRP